MTVQPEENLEEALTFALASIKLAIFRLQTRLERLEEAFLAANPTAVLPGIPYSDEEVAFFERYKDVIDE